MRLTKLGLGCPECGETRQDRKGEEAFYPPPNLKSIHLKDDLIYDQVGMGRRLSLSIGDKPKSRGLVA
jgi:hypothetical protein